MIVRLLCSITIIMLSISACNLQPQQIKFNRVQWDDGDIEIYPYRDAMLNDLFINHPLKGMNYKQLTKLLGEPNRWEKVNLDSPYYVINTDYESDIDPVYTKTLTIYLNKDSVITNYKIEEWGKKK